MPARKFGSAEIGVLWDIEFCPIPCDLSPDDIYDNIKSVLGKLGYCGKLTIKAYSRKYQDPLFQSSKIELFRTGGKRSRAYRILKNAFMWAIYRREEATNLMVISGDFSEDAELVTALRLLKENDTNILLALPVMAPERLVSIASSLWLWKTLSRGGSPYEVVDDTSASPTSVRRGKSLRQK